MNKNTKTNCNCSHFWWVISILVVIIICLIAVFIVLKTDERVHYELVEILGMISTLLAIVLSVFSILFSYNSSTKADSALSDVKSEVEKIESTYTNLTNILSKNGILPSAKQSNEIDGGENMPEN